MNTLLRPESGSPEFGGPEFGAGGVFDTPEAVARATADVVASVVAAHPNPVLTLPTGSTMKGLYGELRRRVAAGALDLSEVRGVQLDEYVGVGDDTPESFRAWLSEQLLTPAKIDRFLRLPSRAPTATSLASYEASLVALGGVDLAILGIGGNGHVAFNEPGSSADSRTRVVELNARTVRANRQYWSQPDAVPSQAVTQGIGTISEAKSLLLIATGTAKAEILAEALGGPITERVPASLIRNHPRLTVIADRDAAAVLDARH